MTIRNFPEVLRSGSEVEGGLSGPANPIPNQLIDCGCGQMQCPKLAKFATRKLFVGLICWIGLVQAASHAYLHVTGATIARRFQLDPYLMDWILVTADLTPFVLGLAVAYWGDRIHRASWLGALILLQSASYFILIIPHLTHHASTMIEEMPNVTHMSLYADDSPELCTRGLIKVIAKENEPSYSVMIVLILVMIVSGIANVAYYALGISYLDDNTKRKHVTAFIGVIIAAKIIGILLGLFLGWGCLRIDAENFNVIDSYQVQMGAWWLGFPILSILLIVPGLLLSWFPRRLPSEVIKQAAATLWTVNLHNRAPHRETNLVAGSPEFWASFCRLITNRILTCNILATVFCATALVNFVAYEDIFLESRFYMPKPTGMLLGFGDPLSSRVATNIMRPILIGLIVIISGLVLAKSKPRPRHLIGYSFIVILFTLALIVSLIFVTCDKSPIIDVDKGGFNGLSRYCNMDCHCSKDANFRPICESSSTFQFYNPCYAGCTTVTYVDDVKIYNDCQCVDEMTRKSKVQAKDGPCDSIKCQSGWMIFELATSLIYALVASTIVGDLLINVRSVYAQDKAISIGLWMTWIAFFAYGPGRILYEIISHQTCQYWGDRKAICHLHHGQQFGDYLCYLTIVFLLLGLLLKIPVWFFCRDLQLYRQVDEKDDATQDAEQTATVELEELMPVDDNNRTVRQVEAVVGSQGSSGIPAVETRAVEQVVVHKEEESNQKSVPSNGRLGPSETGHPAAKRDAQLIVQNPNSEDELDSSSDESKKQSSPQVAYAPLELDSDVESDLSSTGPRSRKRVPSKDYDQGYQDDQLAAKGGQERFKGAHFPNPDHYGDPRRARSRRLENPEDSQDGISLASSFEFSKRSREGDFNEVGIPVVEPFPRHHETATANAHLKDVKSLIDRYEQNASRETLDEDESSVKSAEDTATRSDRMGIRLVAMVPGKSSSRGQPSSAADGLPDARDKTEVRRVTLASPKNIVKGNKPSHQTDL